MQQHQHGIVRRGFSAIGRGWAASLGFTGIAAEGQRIARGVSAVFGFVYGRLADRTEHRHETFEAAVRRLNLSDDDLIRQGQAFQLRARWWLCSMFLSAAWLLGLLITDQGFSAGLVCIAVMLVCWSKSITWHFRACQIRDAELYSFPPFLFSPRRW